MEYLQEDLRLTDFCILKRLSMILAFVELDTLHNYACTELLPAI
jgi:hypothetical protein